MLTTSASAVNFPSANSCIRAQSIETMATAHLISGLPCSGKTTYSMALSADADRVCFSLDCWLITSFGPYSIDSVGHDEHVRRVLVCRQLIWEVASEFLRRDIDVILDDGFFLRAHRIEYVAMSSASGQRQRPTFCKRLSRSYEPVSKSETLDYRDTTSA